MGTAAVVGTLVAVGLSGPTPPASAATLTCFGEAATIIGTGQPDKIIGTDGADVIVGRGGRDVIDGRGGNDLIGGSAGADRLAGGAGDDRLDGGEGWNSVTFAAELAGVQSSDTPTSRGRVTGDSAGTDQLHDVGVIIGSSYDSLVRTRGMVTRASTRV